MLLFVAFVLGTAGSIFRGGIAIVGVVLFLANQHLLSRRLALWCAIGCAWSTIILPASWKPVAFSAYIGRSLSRNVWQIDGRTSLSERVSRWIGARFDERLSPRAASLEKALLYGERLASSRDRTLVREAGVSHMVAVSGANLLFLMTLLLAPTRRLVRRWWIQWILRLLACFFVVLLTGASSSMVRAGIMATLLLSAPFVGRRLTFGRALLLSVWIMTLIDPRWLWFDIGFLLSVFACLGLWMAGQPERQAFFLLPLVRMQWWAWWWTAPLLVWCFGSLSAVGLVTGLLLGPLIPLLQTLGVLTALLPASVPLLHLLEWLLSCVWQVIDEANRWQLVFPRALQRGFLLLFFLLPMLLIHRIVKNWSPDASNVLDTWRKKSLSLLESMHLLVSNVFDTCPDLVMSAIVSMLKKSASNARRGGS